MPQYIRKPRPVEAFQWDRHADRRSWPLWAQLFRGNDPMGQLAEIGNSAVGTLMISQGAKTTQAEPADWLVFDGEVVDDGYGAKTVRGTITVVSPQQFAADYEALGGEDAPTGVANSQPEPAPEAPAADDVKPADA